MKKSLLALAALTAFAGAASAQSSVTLFGLVDLSIRSVDNDNGSRTVMTTNGNSSSRLGVRGIEDLGGGLRAGFWLEGDVSYDNGHSVGQSWQRRSTVSLIGSFGELRLGRDYTPTFWNHTIFDPFGTNGVGSQLNVQATTMTAATTYVRTNNSIGYFLPSMGGVYGQVMYAVDESPTSTDTGYFGGRFGYSAGPINVAAAYGETKLEAGGSLKATNLGGSFKIGSATLMGAWLEYKGGGRKSTNYLLGATVPVGQGVIKASYNKADGWREASQIAVGYVHSVSKRTSLYAHYSVVDNEALSSYTAGSGGKARAPVTGFGSTGMEVGIVHVF